MQAERVLILYIRMQKTNPSFPYFTFVLTRVPFGAIMIPTIVGSFATDTTYRIRNSNMNIFSRIFHKTSQKTCRGTVVGASAKVVEPVNNLAGSGEVMVGGELWAARSVTDDVTFAVGDTVRIVACEGVRLICRK